MYQNPIAKGNLLSRDSGEDPACGEETSMSERQAKQPRLIRAILTDSHFWVPALVLACGIALLAAIQAG